MMEEVHELKEASRLQFFPIMLFAVVMGFSGLTIAYQKAHEIFHFSAYIAEALVFVDTVLFVMIALIYSTKVIRYFEEVKKEFKHPVRINFFAAISISLLLLAIVYRPYFLDLSEVLFILGVTLHTFFTFYTISFWINHNFEIAHSNPAWFIPIVGNVIVPVAGAGIASMEFLMFYFSVGMLFWVVLFTVIFYRIIFHHQLAQKFMPTLFILIAPPAVGFLAYIKLGHGFDFAAHFLFNTALFFTLLLMFMYRNFLNLKFFISWWAFTFPLAAITIATMLAYHLSHSEIYFYIAHALLAMTTFVVFFVAYRTVEHMFKREVCINEH